MSIDAISLAAKALDGLHMRQAALAYNLANISTPGFQPVELDFEQALRSAAAQGPGAIEGLRFAFRLGKPMQAGDEPRQDLMLIDASNNAMHYAALADMTSRRFAIASAAIGVR